MRVKRMSKVGLVYDPVYLKHDTGAHVENSSRLVETVSLLKKSQLMDKLVAISPRAAILDEIALVHSQSHISRVHTYSKKGGGWLDGDTYASPASYDVALQAVGGVLQGLDAVMAGEVNHAFALVRPPGHHATPEEAMGFCLFNNIAIAATYAKRKYKLERILIADFDVHHGNGTQEIFYADPKVLYFSSHQYPWYPGTGSIYEDGADDGKGFTVNVPLPAYCGDTEHLRVYKEILVPVAKRFQPQLMLVSAGYDPHWADQLSLMQLTCSGFAGIVKIIKGLADELCHGKLLLTLEGGYNLEALSYSIKATLEILLGNSPSPDPLGKPQGAMMSPNIDPILEEVKTKHKLG
jgi:acetoin utilization deacetylase AcuC-like enzyme